MSGCHMRKLSGDDAVDLRELYESGDFTMAQLSEMYDLSMTSVYRIINGYSYKAFTGGTAVELPNGRKRATGIQGHPGETHPCSKLTEKQVMEIRRIWAEQMSQQEIADYYHVSMATVINIIHQHSWRHLPSVDDIRKEMQNGIS